MLCATPAVATQTFFVAANQYIFGWKNPPKDCTLLYVDVFFLILREDEITAFRSNSVNDGF